MIVTINYEFILNGKKYEAMGADIADTEKQEDIFDDVCFDIRESKLSAIFNALKKLNLEDEEYEKLIDKCDFTYLVVKCDELEREFII